MIGRILVVVAGMMLLMVQLASASEFEDCEANCGKKFQECIAKIDKPNDIEVQELTQQCTNLRSDCNHFCDDRGDDPYREEKEKAAREQQEKDLNGGKTLEYQINK